MANVDLSVHAMSLAATLAAVFVNVGRQE